MMRALSCNGGNPGSIVSCGIGSNRAPRSCDNLAVDASSANIPDIIS